MGTGCDRKATRASATESPPAPSAASGKPVPCRPVAKPALTNDPAALKRLLRSLPAPAAPAFTAELAAKLVKLSLECVGREYPNKPSDVQASDKEVLPPRKLHPAFFGCFDWHSAVHGHWTMVRVLKLHPKLPLAKQIATKLDRHLTQERLAAELDYFKKKHHRLYERPYGWGWFLRLSAELRTFGKDHRAARWLAALEPLEKLLVARTIDYLQRLSRPVRAGTHHSTAYALAHIHDYARVAGNTALRTAIDRAARRFYLADRGCPTDYEPSGEDFISPCLAEADLMRRVLSGTAFTRWLTRFLPPVASKRFAPLLRPPPILDKKDAKIGHLIGLSFHRAGAARSVARALPPRDPRRALLERVAAIHVADALRIMFESGYGGTHWLASFATFALTE